MRVCARARELACVCGSYSEPNSGQGGGSYASSDYSKGIASAVQLDDVCNSRIGWLTQAKPIQVRCETKLTGSFTSDLFCAKKGEPMPSVNQNELSEQTNS